MMESGDLYSLSNSTADESSNKSDSSIGQGFDSNLCAYQDYDRSSELDLINNFKYTEDEGPDPDKPRKKDAKGLDLEYKKKIDVGATSATTSESCASGLSVQRQMSIAKSKGLFNIFSSNVDPEVLYRPPELPMKSPPTSAYYKNKRFQHFKDEFTLNLSRQDALVLPDKNGNENQKLDGFAFNNRLMKEVGLANLQREQDKIDPMAEHARDVLSSDKLVSFERLRGGSLAENPPAESSAELRHLHTQSTSRLPNRFDALNFERIKHGSFIAKDEGSTSIRSSMTREAFMTHLQQTHPQQQHQQQQTKSFTIDAILGLRSNQRDKHRTQQFRKGQDDPQGKHSSAGSCSGNSNGGGKLKRVRTIFTAEQLERLEGEFSRQQYMVGPERLYLAHALRLTEAQVKVWFQNRRIKWRKLNHEQQSQRLHELHQRSLSSLEHEDSNETGEW